MKHKIGDKVIYHKRLWEITQLYPISIPGTFKVSGYITEVSDKYHHSSSFQEKDVLIPVNKLSKKLYEIH